MFPRRQRRGLGGMGGGVDIITLLLLARLLNENLPPVTLATSVLPILIQLNMLPISRSSISCSSGVETVHRLIEVTKTVGGGGAGIAATLQENGSIFQVLQQLLTSNDLGTLCVRVLPQPVGRCMQSVFFHSSSTHMYLLVGSWMYKARTAERRMGSVSFVLFLMVAMIGSCFLFQCVSVALVLFTDPSWFGPLEDLFSPEVCAGGLGGLVFALKATQAFGAMRRRRLNQNNNGGDEEDHADVLAGTLRGLFGRQRMEYAVWLELLWVQLMAPNSSAVQHLTAILFGFVFVECGGEQWVTESGAALERLVGIRR